MWQAALLRGTAPRLRMGLSRYALVILHDLMEGER